MKFSGTKEKIFDAAIDLFSQRGYNGVSIRDLAKSVGIKESSIYSHYINKEDILNHILDYHHDGMLSKREDICSLENEINFMVPRDVVKLIFFNYGKNDDPRIDKTARIIFMEQYVNSKAKEFVQKYMLEEPVEYYKSLFVLMQSKGRIKSGLDLEIAAQELNYGFLGISLDLALVRQHDGDVSHILKKISNHVDFIFEQIEQ
jgi:AcrR family transcriptional regulator